LPADEIARDPGKAIAEANEHPCPVYIAAYRFDNRASLEYAEFRKCVIWPRAHERAAIPDIDPASPRRRRDGGIGRSPFPRRRLRERVIRHDRQRVDIDRPAGKVAANPAKARPVAHHHPGSIRIPADRQNEVALA